MPTVRLSIGTRGRSGRVLASTGRADTAGGVLVGAGVFSLGLVVVLEWVFVVGEVEFGVSVPAFAALLHPESTVRLSARRALRDQRRPAGDTDDALGAGFGVDNAVQDRSDTDAVGDGEVLYDVQREAVQRDPAGGRVAVSVILDHLLTGADPASTARIGRVCWGFGR